MSFVNTYIKVRKILELWIKFIFNEPFCEAQIYYLKKLGTMNKDVRKMVKKKY